jgi:hypothetical protein
VERIHKKKFCVCGGSGDITSERCWNILISYAAVKVCKPLLWRYEYSCASSSPNRLYGVEKERVTRGHNADVVE